MSIRGLRILPPFAIGRLGSASRPLDSYTIEDDSQRPLGFRRIVGALTLEVDEETGEIAKSWVPKEVRFKHEGRIRPVAPFLEVFAVMGAHGGEETLEPLDIHLMQSLQAKIEWRVMVANRKVARRTGNEQDLVAAETGLFSDHGPHRLLGRSDHFIPDEARVDFGQVRFIKPNASFPEIRLRFTPAKGLIYGPTGPGPDGESDDPVIAGRAIYDRSQDWFGFGKEAVANETVPPSLYAIDPPAPSWLNDNIAISRGYLDDSCDGFAEARLTLPDGRQFTATARICAGPPALVPDSLFVRSLADDLDQVIHGPKVSPSEDYEVTRDRAADIVRRAYETVRFMNVALMNGNNFKGRPALDLDSMPEEEAADTERAIRPIMGPGTVDTLAILALHEQVFAALRGGAAPWFVDLLRQPDQVGDFTDRGRRKMPALMCGADNSYLALTWRQIDTVRQAAEKALFHTKKAEAEKPQDAYVDSAPKQAQLRPRNLSAQLHYEAAGNPISSRPITAVANCCPGLEVDFRAVWRRMFTGVELREYDNLVMVEDPPDATGRPSLVGHRLLRVRLPGQEPAFWDKQQEIAAKRQEVREKQRAIPEEELAALEAELDVLNDELATLKGELATLKSAFAIRHGRQAASGPQTDALEQEAGIPEKRQAVRNKEQAIAAKQQAIREQATLIERELAARQKELGPAKAQLTKLEGELEMLRRELALSEEQDLRARQQAVWEKQEAIEEQKKAMRAKEAKLGKGQLPLREELGRQKKRLAALNRQLAALDKERAFLMTTEIKGPASSDVEGEIVLTTENNPYGLTALEWSNALAHVLSGHQGEKVWCDFTSEEAEQMQPLIDAPQKNYLSLEFEVRHFFEEQTAVISRALAKAGELTQGLCSPWQNDYRECSCYYWASARPDYINVEPGPTGLSQGDNWLQKERTGSYVPDDYSDSRLILYDDLFEDWEKYLKFQVGGKDVPDEAADKGGKAGH